jgi:hypothetical protein
MPRAGGSRGSTTMSKALRDQDYLEHIQDAIDEI